MGGNVFFKQVFDGEKGYTSQMGQKTDISGKALVRAQRSMIFPNWVTDPVALRPVLLKP